MSYSKNKERLELSNLKIIALTHKNVELDDIGKFHLEDTLVEERLNELKNDLELGELMYMSTCNRVEFVFTSNEAVDDEFALNFFMAFKPKWRENELLFAVQKAQIFSGEEAVVHLFNVASSIDSLVIGEREIITQVRTAFDNSQKMNLTGEITRLLTKQTILAAKAVYTQTSIARNPVSVVSLAYRKLKEQSINQDSRFLVIGSGKTNKTMAKFLKKHGCKNFIVYNRTISNAVKFSEELGGEGRPLTELKNHKEPFDVILTCTASSSSILTEEVYTAILNGDTRKKVVVDLAIPNDFDVANIKNHNVELLSINELKEVAKINLKERAKELSKCHKIIEDNLHEFKQLFRQRRIELAMKDVPKQVKEIKKNALDVVFHKEYESLDEQSKEILEKVMAYVEKKYVSGPMKLAKEILIETEPVR